MGSFPLTATKTFKIPNKSEFLRSFPGCIPYGQKMCSHAARQGGALAPPGPRLTIAESTVATCRPLAGGAATAFTRRLGMKQPESWTPNAAVCFTLAIFRAVAQL
jgi:hypothetical protein